MIIPAILLPYEDFIFDLDDTLYNETDYLFPAYESIGRMLEEKTGTDADKAASFLKNTLKVKGRKQLFDACLSFFSLPADLKTDMLNILRTSSPPAAIHLFPGMYDCLETLISHNKRIFIITNGNPGQQQNKVSCIDWKGLEHKIIFAYANAHKPKPANDSFIFLDATHKFIKPVYIGDSETDREFATQSGIPFIHFRELLK